MSLFGSSTLLDKTVCSLLLRRKSTTKSGSYLYRFSECDQVMLDLLSTWESQYAHDYPIFHAWIKLQRKRLPIREISENVSIQVERSELKVFDIVKRKDDLSRESQSVETELDSILKIFTPTLEEAFANIDAEPLTDHHLHESVGTNDDLFRVAREKYNYLLKKLIPRMSKLVEECESTVHDMSKFEESYPTVRSEPTGERWNKCKKSLLDISASLQRQSRNISSSSTYSNLMVLLASKEQGKPVKRHRPEDPNMDKEYEDWF
jgi:hypothetical protein